MVRHFPNIFLGLEITNADKMFSQLKLLEVKHTLFNKTIPSDLGQRKELGDRVRVKGETIPRKFRSYIAFFTVQMCLGNRLLIHVRDTIYHLSTRFNF